jgi:Fur family transcriptional regulator, zinc uptake regulator
MRCRNTITGATMASRKGAEHATNIMDALTEAARPLSAYDLLDRLRPTGVAAPLTVYRALDKLIAAGKVHRIESLNAFVACRGGEHHHGGPVAPQRTVAFRICGTCGVAEEFVNDDLFTALDRSAVGNGFAPLASAVEVHGTCAGCQLRAQG